MGPKPIWGSNPQLSARIFCSLHPRNELFSYREELFSKISLAFLTGKWHSIYLHAALPQLDRGPDYESGRHRFESYTPHHLNLGAPPGALFYYLTGLKATSPEEFAYR